MIFYYMIRFDTIRLWKTECTLCIVGFWRRMSSTISTWLIKSCYINSKIYSAICCKGGLRWRSNYTATNSDDNSYFCFYSSQLLKWITLCGTSFLWCHLLKINSRKKNFENRNPGLEKKIKHLWIWTVRVYMPWRWTLALTATHFFFHLRTTGK